MNIEIKDTVVLDDKNEYVVASKIKYQDKNYLYLSDIVNHGNIKFCYESPEGDRMAIIEVEDKEFVKTLLPLFYEASKHLIEEFMNQSNNQA